MRRVCRVGFWVFIVLVLAFVAGTAIRMFGGWHLAIDDGGLVLVKPIGHGFTDYVPCYRYQLVDFGSCLLVVHLGCCMGIVGYRTRDPIPPRALADIPPSAKADAAVPASEPGGPGAAWAVWFAVLLGMLIVVDSAGRKWTVTIGPFDIWQGTVLRSNEECRRSLEFPLWVAEAALAIGLLVACRACLRRR